jgi:hypothetical protein
MARCVRFTAAVVTVLVAIVALAVVVASPNPSSVASAADAAEFDPMEGSTSFGPAAFGRVVTNGAGAFLMAQRVQLPIGQYIAVRRSGDGGRSWVTRGFFSGEGGGGTRPWISMSGDNVAVGYIGAWCGDPTTPGVCGEAPYLVTSTDAGVTWGSPRRLDRQAFDIQVAQDGARTWVTWDSTNGVQLRGTRDGGASMFASRSLASHGSQHLAAAEGLAVLAFSGAVDRLTSTPLALVARGDVVSTIASPLEDSASPDLVTPWGAAVADGRLHVLVRRIVQTGPYPRPTSYEVMTAASDGVFSTVHEITDDSAWSTSITAGPGVVAVAVGSRDGVTSVATSSDGGTSFSSLLPVANTSGAEPNVQIGLAIRPVDKPIARFGWSVPDRFVDENGDTFLDPANDTGSDSGDAMRVYLARTLEVTLDACRSTPPAGRTIAGYRWTQEEADGTSTVLPFGGCKETLSFESGEERTIRLDVTDSAGEQSSTVQVVAPRDLVVASLGDSVASGEGNPHERRRPGFPARWQDEACHRSVAAGPALAAEQLEKADPHTSVTFIQLSCSGAAIVDSPEVPGVDDPNTGGVLDGYHGQQPSVGSLRVSQMQQLRDLIGNRKVDALMLSVGANDARFSDVVKACIETSHCERTSVRTDFESRAAELPARYARLASAIAALGVDPSAVHISEYFDPTTDELGVTQMRCAVLGGLYDLLDDDEARWASTGVLGALNNAVSAASATHGWTYVGGLAAAFVRHGYCSSDSWVVGVVESKLGQDNIDGAFHPNRKGHEAYGRGLYASLRRALLVPPPVGGTSGTVGVDLLGDIVVTTATRSSFIATGLRDTGGAPGLLGSRIVDRVVSGDGALYAFGPPAIDRSVAVGVWTQLPISGQTLTAEVGGQIALRPNAAVRAVSVVQAPMGGRYLVAARPAVVSATIDAAIDAPMDLAVSVDVVTLPPDSDDPDAPPGRPVLSDQMNIRVRPGINKVLLPSTGSFQLAPGERVSATVTLTDPPGAISTDDVDNTLSTDDAAAKEAIETRPLTLEFVAPTTSAGRVACSDLSEIARRQTAFGRAAMPVDATGLLTMLSCGELPPLEANEAAILQYLGVLDWLARHSGVDVMVGVVPSGWLSGAAGGAVGVAAAGLRAALIEQSSPAMTLAHEVAHTFGIDHVTGGQKVTGVRVDQRRHLDATDWMSARTPDKAWTGAATWDDLTVRFGPPGGIPAPPAPLSPELEINGAIDNEGQHVPGEWTPGDTGSPRSDLDDLQLERMIIEQVDAGGDVIASDDTALRPVEGLYPPGSAAPAPIGFAYQTRITLLPQTVSVQLVLDGAIVEERPVGAVPIVTVTSPTAGTLVRRGDPIAVEWSTADPVGPGATASILISQDGGGTWKPLATGVTGTAASVAAPADLIDGDAIVRVVVVDEVRAGQGDSGAIDIGVPVQLLDEKVVAVRTDLVDLTVPGATMPAQVGQGIWTMNPDGTDFRQIVAMVPPVNGEGGMVPLHPDWRGDGLAIAFDGEVSGRRDLFVVDRDGSNLRRVTDAATAPGMQFVCADWHPDGRRLLTYQTTGFDLTSVSTLEVVVIDTVTGEVTPFGWTTLNYQRAATQIGCPRWSPDGGEILMATFFRDRFGDTGDVYVIDVDTRLSKYAYYPNNGALQGNSYASWLNFAPTNDDRFVALRELFAFGSLRVAKPVPTPLFIGGDIVWRDLPTTVWSTDSIPMITEYKTLFESVGFLPDGNGLWFTTTRNLQPRRYQEQRFDFRVGYYTVVVTEQVGHLCTVPVEATFEPTDPVTCYVPGGDGVPVEAIADETTTPGVPSAAPTVGISMADWHSGVSVGVDPDPPIVIEDPATLPPDPEDPPPGDVDTPTPAGTPAPDADDRPPLPTPTPVATTFTVPAGRSTRVVLPASQDALAPVTIVTAPDAGTIEVRPAVIWPNDPWTTGADRAVDITPAAGFLGRATFQVAPRGGTAEAVTITVNVVAAPVPRAVDDVIEVKAAVVAVVDPAELLANDRPSTAPASPSDPNPQLLAADPSLRLVSVHGFDGGTAVLRLDGMIEVMADRAGTFTYTVADTSGAVADAQVSVRLAMQVPPPSPTDPPTPTSPAPPPVTTPVVPPPGAVPAVGPATGVVPATTTPGDMKPSDVTLPETGADITLRLRLAGFSLIVGIALVIAVRRRRQPDRSL